MTNSVFIKRGSKAAPQHAGLPLLHLVKVRPKGGEIGIEIEVEGNKFPKGMGHELEDGDHLKIPKQWSFTHDGSLRGQDNAEYVLTQPIKFSEVEKAVTDLWQMFEDYGSVLDDSNRTSVHVHLNVQNFHLNRLCSFVAMYFVVEDLLTNWCGDHRVGNLFCLRAKDAPAIVRRLKEFFQQDGYGYKFSSGMHYAGLNPSAIHKFGSIEIRSLRGVSDPQVILDWVSVLERLYTLSAEFKDPREVVSGFSGNGPIAWLQNLLGDKFEIIMNNVPYTTEEVRNILYEGIRFAQDLCYCRDWSEYEEKEFKGDPFLRDPKPISAIEALAFTPSSTSSVPYSPLATEGYSHEYLISILTALNINGAVSNNVYDILRTYSKVNLENWLIGAGHINPYDSPDPESQDYYEEDYDEVFDEDDE